ncbi:MAG: hypothetical protein IJK97_15260 [Thermoguttaceae bacterium]|nr:hypothetical protein [Thermoguttaceae bacterium]MBR0192480.1 hypothetical protein [Thermoguttaceae bacterium]
MAANIFYRTFRNMDGPGICLVWNRSWYAGVRGEKVRSDSFDQFIASKLFFDPAHLVVAVEAPEEKAPNGLSDGRIVGFVHGGFGPNQEMNGCDKSVGYIAMLIVEEREDQQEIRARLLYEMEKIFFRMGIRTVFAGAVYPNAPFYMGRLFGCELNGILENDPFLPQILLRNQYIAVERHHILTFILRDRLSLSFGQRFLVPQVEMVTPDDSSFWRDQANSPANRLGVPIERDWWEVCAHSNMEWNRYILLDRNTSESIAWVGASVMTRNGQMPLLGLHHLYVKPQFRHKGFARLFLTLVLNQLQLQYHTCQVELLVSERNTSALQMFTGLHFEITSTGNVYRRELPADFPETFQLDRSLEKGTEVHA